MLVSLCIVQCQVVLWVDIHKSQSRYANPHDPRYMEYIPQAVTEGLLKEAAVDAALRNALGIRFRLGLFDQIEDQPVRTSLT